MEIMSNTIIRRLLLASGALKSTAPAFGICPGSSKPCVSVTTMAGCWMRFASEVIH